MRTVLRAGVVYTHRLEPGHLAASLYTHPLLRKLAPPKMRNKQGATKRKSTEKAERKLVIWRDLVIHQDTCAAQLKAGKWGHPGRGEETPLSQTLGARDPRGQGPTSSRSAGVSPLLCRGASWSQDWPSAPSLCPCCVALLLFLSLAFQSSLCLQNTRPYQTRDVRVFFPASGLSPHSLLYREATDFDEVNGINFSFFRWCLDITSEKYLSNPKSRRFHPAFSSRSVIVFIFIYVYNPFQE